MKQSQLSFVDSATVSMHETHPMLTVAFKHYFLALVMLTLLFEMYALL